MFLLDYKGRNQCELLQVTLVTDDIAFSDSTLRPGDITGDVNLNDINTISTSDITNIGTI